MNLSGSYSKSEEIIDIFNIPYQLISAALNFRIDLFNQIFSVIQEINKNLISPNEIIENIYFLSKRIKLIIIKAIVKSMILNNEKMDDLFYFNNIYGYKDLYLLFSEEEFFLEFKIEKVFFYSKKFEENLEIPQIENSDKNKFICVMIFQINLLYGFFTNKIEKINSNLKSFFSMENNKHVNLAEENMILKDFHTINCILDELSSRLILIIKIFVLNISNLFWEKNENLENSNNLIEGKININFLDMKTKNFFFSNILTFIFSNYVLPFIKEYYLKPFTFDFSLEQSKINFFK